MTEPQVRMSWTGQKGRRMAENSQEGRRMAENSQAVSKELEKSIINACESGDWSFIQEYLHSGRDVNAYLSSGWTLLLHAASGCQTELVRRLIEHGADPNLYHEGYSPLMALSWSSKAEPDERLRCLECLLEAGANVNATNKLRETALIFAARHQEPDFVLKLLEHGAHIDYADTQEWTALLYAVADNRLEVVELLVERGADLTLKNYEGLDAYNVAVLKGYDKLSSLLDVGQPDVSKAVPVHSIVRWNDLFPRLSKLQPDEIDDHVESILYGMGLNSYKKCFCGIDLTTFLNLQEEDLVLLGVDLKLHRDKFVEGLVKFHKHEWNNNLVKVSLVQNFTAFEAIKILGNVNKQLNVMSGSMYFSKKYLDELEKSEESNLTHTDREKIEEEIMNMRLATLKIKDFTLKIRRIVNHMNKKNSDLSLPIFIGTKQEKGINTNNSICKWVMITIVSAVSIYLLKVNSTKGLWNYEKWLMQELGISTVVSVLHKKLNGVSIFLQKNLNFLK